MIRTRLIVWRLALLAGALCCSARANGDEPAAAATSAATVRKEDAPAAAAPYGEQPILAVDAGGHTGRIDRLVLSAYGDQLISISHDKTIRFWDVNSGEPLRVLRPAIGDGLEGQLYSVALSPDGSKLAVGGFRALTPVNDHRVLVISLPDGQLLYRLKGHLGPIRGLAFSPDGSRLASASQDHTLRLWNMETGGAVASLTGHLDYVLSLAWSPDGKRLVSGAWDRTARVWSVESGKTEAVLTGHARDVLSVAWSRDGRTIATGAADKSIRLWEPNGVFRFAWHNLDNDVQMVAFSEDATQLLYSWGSRENSVHGTAILDLKDGHERSRFTGHSNTPMAGVLLSGGTLAATAGAPGDICLWNTTSGKLERRLSSRGQSVAAVGWSTDGRAIAWGHSYTGNMARGTNPLERTFCLETLTFGAAPDASFFTTRSTHEDLGIERVSERRAVVRRNGRVISRLEIPDIGDKIRCRTLLSERRAILGTNLRLYQFNIDTGTQTRWLVGHTDTIHAIAPSGDFRYLLSGGVDQTLRIWKLATGELLLTLFFAGDEWIAWTPQGYYAASLGGEGLMGWHLNGTGDSMASFYPASRFHKTLYRPDVIRGLLAHGTLAQALAAADRERARASEPIILSAALPPTVTLMTPAEQKVTLTEPTITIRARAAPAGPDPITSMRLIVNGRPGERKQRAAPPADTDAGVAEPSATDETWTLTLPPGTHQIAVKAETKTSDTVSDPVEVVAPAAGPIAPPVMYVLAIGVSRYPEAGQDLPFAAVDAQAVAELLRGNLRLFSRVDVRLLTDQSATRQAILSGLEWLRQSATPQDVAIVFYAGRSSNDERHGLHLLPVDADRVQPGASGIPESLLRGAVESTRGRVLVWMDARDSDAAGQRQGYCVAVPADQEAGRAAGEDLLRDLATDDYGAAVIGTGAGRDAPLDVEGATHGVLTQALLDGLGGTADSSGDGMVALDELERFVKDRVKALSGNRQRAVTGRPAMVRPFPVFRAQNANSREAATP